MERGRQARASRSRHRGSPGADEESRAAHPSRFPRAKVRGLVCAARIAEDSGRFEDAAAAWRSLGDPEQVLRCRVTNLDRAGDLDSAARLLESRERYEAAAVRWARAGDAAGAARCRALLDEKRGHLREAALGWEALGEPKRAERCRAILHFRQHEYAEAAQGFDAAGEPGMALTARLLAAKLTLDYEAAQKAVKESATPDAYQSLLGNRQTWLAEARAFAASHARARSAALPRRGRAHRWPRPVGEPGPAHRADIGSGGHGGPPVEAAEPADISRAILDAVRRFPGLTSEGVARLTALATARVKPHLAALTASGQLRKVGRTRGTRYLPA